jgi:protoporphyrinogen/coproporphyrinogen III oxidase
MSLLPNNARSHRIAIVGGGISGLAAAYELARLGAEFTLFEASGRLGGIVETVHTQGFVIECGPDSWVTEKPWAKELAIELGLEDQILVSNDDRRRTYLVKNTAGLPTLIPIPDGMRMMVPTQWEPILESPLFSEEARQSYLREPARADELRAAAVGCDESVAEFVRRHFGEEVTRTIAGPLLAGVFGGDVETLSVRAAMPAFVAMEAEHGSLITALEKRIKRSTSSPQPIFSSLSSGLGTLIDHLVARLPEASVQLQRPVTSLDRDGDDWRILTSAGAPAARENFHSVILATPAHITRKFLAELGASGPRMAELLPARASSAVVVALAFDAPQAARINIPRGFGFLVPPAAPSENDHTELHGLLACTFVDQKFAHRVPEGAVLLRAFFGGNAAETLSNQSDESLIQLAREQLARVLTPQENALPVPAHALVRRWPLSLPQYAVGHLERMAELETLASSWTGLHLAGNAYHGVGLPDLIRDGRTTARNLLKQAS